MPGTGINKDTGRWLTGWDHVLQSLVVIFTTRIGSRFMRRVFGSAVPRLLGEPLNERTITRYIAAIIVAIEIWEPRFRIVRIDILKEQNIPDRLRAGRFAMAMRGVYRPRGHLGDFAVAPGERTVVLGLGAQGVLAI